MSEFKAKPWAQWFGATPDHKPDYVEMVEQEVRQLMESRGLPKDDKNIEHALACAYMRGIDSVDKYLRNSLSAYRNSARGPQWISVKDRLPETNELCIVNTEWRGIVPATYGNESWIFDENQGWLEKPLSYASHWMPLPEAPKEEK